jgi:hypothetical protein
MKTTAFIHPSSFIPPEWAHGFASPPYDGFAIIEDDKVTQVLAKQTLGEPLLINLLVKKT